MKINILRSRSLFYLKDVYFLLNLSLFVWVVSFTIEKKERTIEKHSLYLSTSHVSANTVFTVMNFLTPK